MFIVVIEALGRPSILLYLLFRYITITGAQIKAKAPCSFVPDTINNLAPGYKIHLIIKIRIAKKDLLT